ncbi:MAG TPA: hypothetical protein PKY05_06775 [Fibrobacteria bacterium]|nr:hypothetical protein [Fibrobacteria bacterium]
MSLDPSREALLRVAREIDLDPSQHPDHLATGIIRHIHRQKAASDSLETLLQSRHTPHEEPKECL